MRSLILALLLAVPVKAQVPFVTIIEPGTTVSRVFASTFDRSVAENRELLLCVTNVQTATSRGGFTIKHVLEVREEDVKSDTSTVHLTGRECVDAEGKKLPMIHTHPGGTCQAYPHDVETILQRMAEFDGVLCGPHSHAWYFSGQLVAVWMKAMDVADAKQAP